MGTLCLASGQCDLQCKIKETLLIRDLKPTLNENVGSENPGGVLPFKGLMGTCGQPGYVFRDFCHKQGIEFIIFCLN